MYLNKYVLQFKLNSLIVHFIIIYFSIRFHQERKGYNKVCVFNDFLENFSNRAFRPVIYIAVLYYSQCKPFLKITHKKRNKRKEKKQKREKRKKKPPKIQTITSTNLLVTQLTISIIQITTLLCLHTSVG